MFKSFGINGKVTRGVVDGGSNYKAAIEHAVEWARDECLAHMLQNCVKDAIKVFCLFLLGH